MSEYREYWLEKIRKELVRRDEKWGEQGHHLLTWFSIIGEEYGEMCKAFNDYFLERHELRDHSRLLDMQVEAIHVAACCVAMLECLHRKIGEGLIP